MVQAPLARKPLGPRPGKLLMPPWGTMGLARAGGATASPKARSRVRLASRRKTARRRAAAIQRGKMAGAGALPVRNKRLPERLVAGDALGQGMGVVPSARTRPW